MRRTQRFHTVNDTLPPVPTARDDALADAWRRAAHEFVADDAGRSVTIAGGATHVAVAGDIPRPGASVLKLGRVNVTTTDDCARLLAAIHREEHLAPILTALRANLNHTRIQLRLPDETIVAHKTGSLSGVVNDVGVIHAESGFLTVCFLTDGQPDPAATAADIGECALRALTAWTAAGC